MASWWVPYLAKSCRPDFNYGLEGDSNGGPILALRRLFKSDSNNGPSPGYSNLLLDGVCICSGLLLMVSWWVPYLAKGCRPDFNNGLGGDSNSGPILVPLRLFKSDSNTGPSQAIPIFCQIELHLFRSPTYGFLTGPLF